MVNVSIDSDGVLVVRHKTTGAVHEFSPSTTLKIYHLLLANADRLEEIQCQLEELVEERYEPMYLQHFVSRQSA